MKQDPVRRFFVDGARLTNKMEKNEPNNRRFDYPRRPYDIVYVRFFFLGARVIINDGRMFVSSDDDYHRRYGARPAFPRRRRLKTRPSSRASKRVVDGLHRKCTSARTLHMVTSDVTVPTVVFQVRDVHIQLDFIVRR